MVDWGNNIRKQCVCKSNRQWRNVLLGFGGQDISPEMVYNVDFRQPKQIEFLSSSVTKIMCSCKHDTTGAGLVRIFQVIVKLRIMKPLRLYLTLMRL